MLKRLKMRYQLNLPQAIASVWTITFHFHQARSTLSCTNSQPYSTQTGRTISGTKAQQLSCQPEKRANIVFAQLSMQHCAKRNRSCNRLQPFLVFYQA